MKRLIMLACVALLYAWLAVGCQQQTESGGQGAGNDIAAGGPKSFTLSIRPVGDSLKQGGQTQTSVSINPRSEFTEQVTVTFQAPPGIIIEPAELKLSKELREERITIRAEATADVGDHDITILGTPTNGPVVEDKFKVAVGQGDSAAVPDDAVPAE